MITAGRKQAGFDSAGVCAEIRIRQLQNTVHDLASSAFTVRGYVRMAIEEQAGATDGPANSHLEAALRSVNSLIEELRRSRESPDPSTLQLEIVHFNDVLRFAMEEIAASCAETDVELIETLANQRMTTVVDRGQLAEALRILFRKAVAFIGPGGRLDVSCCENQGNIVLRLSAFPSTKTRPSPPPDLSIPFKIWRSHGGTGSNEQLPAGERLMILELPIVGF